MGRPARTERGDADTSERIALYRIFAASTRLLALVDRKPDHPSVRRGDLDAVVADHEGEIADLSSYYARAGENGARIVYFRGMIWGTAALALALGGSFLAAWWFGWIDPHDEATYTLFVSIAMGAAGAVFSVLTRMAKEGFRLEFEVGRKSIRHLGGIRPWIGALSAFVIYVALKSELIAFFQGVEQGLYFYATIAFISGFSERRATVLINSIAGDDDRDGGNGDKRGSSGDGPAPNGGAATAPTVETGIDEHRG